MALSDKYHRQLQKLIEKAQPQSIEELQELLKSFQGKPLPEMEAESPEEVALDLVEEAWSSNETKGKKLVKKALEIFPDCLPAYEYLAGNTSAISKRLFYLDQALTIGRKIFGGKYLEEHRGHFWGLAETRPYMRCLSLFADEKYLQGKYSEAIVIWEDMLSLNPNDNQGIRYQLLPALLLQKDLKTYDQYRKAYPEKSCFSLFNDVLAEFIKTGATNSLVKTLNVAQKSNSFVVPYLIHEKLPEYFPETYSLGSADEAITCVNYGWEAWQKTPGAIDWLRETTAKVSRKSTKKEVELAKIPNDKLVASAIDALGPVGLIRLKKELFDDLALQVPITQLALFLLAHIQENKRIKLTQKENLPIKLVRQIFDLNLIKLDYPYSLLFKQTKEEEIFQIHALHIMCKEADLVQIQKGFESLTPKGMQLLNKPGQLYLTLIETYIQEVNWSYFERWNFSEMELGQLGWDFVMYDLLRKGHQEKSELYYSKLLINTLERLFPQLSALSINFISNRFQLRFINHFLYFFGLVEITNAVENDLSFLDEAFIKKTALADQVFEISDLI